MSTVHIYHWKEVLSPPQLAKPPRWSEWEDKTPAGIAALLTIGLVFGLWRVLKALQPVTKQAGKADRRMMKYWGSVRSPQSVEEIDVQLNAMRDEWERDF